MLPRRPLNSSLTAYRRRPRLRSAVDRESRHGVTELDLAMMQRALALADQAASMGEVPIGAVVYISPGAAAAGTVLAEAFNHREARSDPSAHAEFSAIVLAAKSRADWRLSDCTLAVTLEPCPMCAGLIVNARVGRVVYGADDPKAGAVRSLFTLLRDTRLNHRPAVIAGVCERECGARLTAFFQQLRQRRRNRGNHA